MSRTADGSVRQDSEKESKSSGLVCLDALLSLRVVIGKKMVNSAMIIFSLKIGDSSSTMGISLRLGLVSLI